MLSGTLSFTIYSFKGNFKFTVETLSLLNPFLTLTNAPLLDPRKHQKTTGFVMFTGVAEVERWLKMG